MREIKFRWTFKRKEDGQIYQIVGDVDLLREYNGLTEMFKNELWELVGRDQYTGLKDVDGKEIYEGDVVKKWWGANAVSGDRFENHVIEFEVGRVGPCKAENVMEWRLSGCENLWNGKDVEVVGNIYETPDLIPKQERE